MLQFSYQDEALGGPAPPSLPASATVRSGAGEAMPCALETFHSNCPMVESLAVSGIQPLAW